MQSVHTRSLQRAAELVGGVDTLAHRLNVSPEKLEYWLSGVLPVPTEVFLALVDLILEEHLSEASRNSEVAAK
ncbi:MAG TPA: YdaS family helix-turn-helix protein [Burkholderiales bacterium]|jgi:DNA-binding transcriptional regulator YdaS (Cro superfamily)|nr:YdaS family helix-turn-helix protein [Burkholderiales bacterium]